jgi:protein-L-isoaspartate(D-aspartate) O-methyltransferase
MDMVSEQIEARGVRMPAVLAAMRRVPRHLFVPDALVAEAYADTPLPIGHGQTISQPYIVALMTELVRPQPDFIVLEIGAGSGYQAAVLAELVRQVYSIEILAPLAKAAAQRLRQAGCRNVEVIHADGYDGWPAQAPYDAIVVTAAAPAVPPPLIQQLNTGKRMVIPIGGPGGIQELVLVEKTHDALRAQNILPVRFVPFTRRQPAWPPEH